MTETVDREPELIVDLIFWGGDPGHIAFDKKWAEGDPKVASLAIRHKRAGWMLSSDAPPTATLQDHLKRIFEKLAAIDLDRVERPASDVELSVAAYCVGSAKPELWIPAPLLAALADLYAQLDFDVYCW